MKKEFLGYLNVNGLGNKRTYKIIRIEEETNIVCSKCGRAMTNDFDIIFPTDPPQYELKCSCGNSKYEVCSNVSKNITL